MIASDLNYEGTQSYNLEITAIDGGTSAKSVTATVSVNIDNVNEFTPTCDSTFIAISMTEPSTVSDSVRSVVCHVNFDCI